MLAKPIDLSSLRKALLQLEEALLFWYAQQPDDPLTKHLRSAVVQAFEFSYELSVRMLRRVMVERAASNDLVSDLSFNDLLRKAADAGLLMDPSAWRKWRELRNATSHTYDEEQAQVVAQGAALFLKDAKLALAAMEKSLEH